MLELHACSLSPSRTSESSPRLGRRSGLRRPEALPAQLELECRCQPEAGRLKAVFRSKSARLGPALQGRARVVPPGTATERPGRAIGPGRVPAMSIDSGLSAGDFWVNLCALAESGEHRRAHSPTHSSPSRQGRAGRTARTDTPGHYASSVTAASSTPGGRGAQGRSVRRRGVHAALRVVGPVHGARTDRRIVRTCTSLNFVALRYYASAGQQACQELTRDRTFAGPRVVEGQGASLEQSIARRRRSAADTQLQYLLVEAAALGPTVASR